jgi:hypothetical protein
VSYLLEFGFTEEESFWLLTNIIENMLPSEYYVNLLPIIAETKILDIIMTKEQSQVWEHFKQHDFD